MNENISKNGSALNFKGGFEYIIIDAFYLGEIKGYIETQNNMNSAALKKQVKEKAFPYSSTPFAEIVMTNDVFKIEAIKKIGYDEKVDSSKRFSSDTGLILLFQTSNFQYLIENFDYEKFTDSDINLVNYDYWSNLIHPIEENTIGTVIAPGIDSGYDFEGGGLYIIEME